MVEVSIVSACARVGQLLLRPLKRAMWSRMVCRNTREMSAMQTRPLLSVLIPRPITRDMCWLVLISNESSKNSPTNWAAAITVRQRNSSEIFLLMSLPLLWHQPNLHTNRALNSAICLRRCLNSPLRQYVRLFWFSIEKLRVLRCLRHYSQGLRRERLRPFVLNVVRISKT